MLDKLYSVEEVARYLDVSAHTVYRYIAENKLKAVKKLGKKRISETSLNEFINE